MIGKPRGAMEDALKVLFQNLSMQAQGILDALKNLSLSMQLLEKNNYFNLYP